MDNIKKYIIPKNCSQCYEIKISNSGKYDEQINLTISSIKNKLFEITKEFKEFRSPPIDITRKNEALFKKLFADPWLDSEKIEFNNMNVDELLYIQ